MSRHSGGRNLSSGRVSKEERPVEHHLVGNPNCQSYIQIERVNTLGFCTVTETELVGGDKASTIARQMRGQMAKRRGRRAEAMKGEDRVPNLILHAEVTNGMSISVERDARSFPRSR